MRSFLLDDRVVRRTEGMSCGCQISHSDFGDGIRGLYCLSLSLSKEVAGVEPSGLPPIGINDVFSGKMATK